MALPLRTNGMNGRTHHLSACGADTQLELRGRVCYCVPIGDSASVQFIKMTVVAASFLRAVLR